MTDTPVESGFRSLGQLVARRLSGAAVVGGRLGRTLLVHGPAGAGKEAFVEDLLALAFCTERDVATRPCNACGGCVAARNRSHPDLVLGSPDGWREARSAGESIVSAARRWLLDASGAPIAGQTRVVLVERADLANDQIQNALLKVLEEPTDRHAFILVADEPSRLLPTIRSRAQALRIGPVPRSELVAHLVDRERLPADQADILARVAGGLSGTAIDYARRPDLLTARRRLQSELLTLLERGRADRFGAVRDLLDEASNAGSAPSGSVDETDMAATRTPGAVQRGAALLLVEAWSALARDLLVTGAGRPRLAPSVELAPDLERLAPRIPPGRLGEVLSLLDRIGEAVRQNTAPRLALEAAMLAWPMLSVRDG